MAYEYQEYPKFLYSKGKQPMVVRSVEEEVSLGDGWHDSPAFIDETPEEIVAEESADADKPKRRGRPPKGPDEETIAEE